MITAVLRRGMQGSIKREGHVTMKEKIRVMCFEEGGKGHKSRNTGDHYKLKKARKLTFPLEPPEGTSLASVLSPVKLILDFCPPELYVYKKSSMHN